MKENKHVELAESFDDEEAFGNNCSANFPGNEGPVSSPDQHEDHLSRESRKRESQNSSPLNQVDQINKKESN